MSANRTDISQINDYLKGILDNNAMHQLERDTQDDAFFMDALDGFELIVADQQDNLDKLTVRLKQRIAQHEKRGLTTFKYWAVAASILMAISIGGWWLLHTPKLSPTKNDMAREAPATIPNMQSSKTKKPFIAGTHKKMQAHRQKLRMASKPTTVKVDDTANFIASNVPSAKNSIDAAIRGSIKRKPDSIAQPAYVVNGKEIQDNPISNVPELLQGKVAKLNIQNGKAAIITGKVTDTSGRPIAGVTVFSQHRAIAQTDTNGRYRVLVNRDSLLAFSNVGYSTQSVLAKQGQSTVDVKLKEQPNALAQIIVRGYVKRNRDETTGASYIVTGITGPCKENVRFKRRFFAKIAIIERYTTEHADSSASTIRDGKFLRALKFIAKRAPTTIKADKTAKGYSDVKTMAQNKAQWLYWYEVNKCKNLK